MILPRAFEAVTISACEAGQFIAEYCSTRGEWNFEMTLSEIIAIYLKSEAKQIYTLVFWD
jgi:hypothetical protein